MDLWGNLKVEKRFMLLGLDTDSILFCELLTIKIHCKEFVFTVCMSRVLIARSETKENNIIPSGGYGRLVIFLQQ